MNDSNKFICGGIAVLVTVAGRYFNTMRMTTLYKLAYSLNFMVVVKKENLHFTRALMLSSSGCVRMALCLRQRTMCVAYFRAMMGNHLLG